MKRLFSFLCVLCCASMMSFAIDWSGVAWLGNGVGEGYTEKYKAVVSPELPAPGFINNLQTRNGKPSIHVVMPSAAFGATSLQASQYETEGAGVFFHLDAFPALENEFTFVCSDVTYTFTVYFADGIQGGGGDPDPDPDPEPDPEPAGIDWSSVAWLGNGVGEGYTEKYKAVVSPELPAPGFINNLQTRNGKPSIHVVMPSAAFGATSLQASQYETEGAGVFFHLDAFPALENKFTFVCSDVTYTFTVYFADGIQGGGGGGNAEPTEIYDVNFALASNGSSATASSGNAGEAIDGNEGTRWESAQTDDETWTLNMGQKRIFNTIKIKWEGAYCKEFALTYSNDGESWSPLYTETNLTQAGWQTIELGENVTAQYIKYHGTKRATGYGQSFFEFQVLLPGVSTLTKIELSAPGIAKVGEGVALNVVAKDQNNAPMTVAIEYEITPAAAGAVVDGKYVPAKIGNASIIAKSGEVKSAAIEIFGYEGSNLALSTNIDTDNKVIAQSDFTPKGTNAFFAVDGNDGSVYQGSPTGGTAEDDASRTFDAWFVVDLGDFYDIDLITIHFEGACSQNYHVDFSADNAAWALGYDYTGNPGINGRTDMLSAAVLDNYQKVRYVRFWSTKAGTQWGMKMFELQVFGHAWVPASDTEAPVMVSATLDSKTWNSVVLAVEATDNQGVAKFHVVDATNGIDAKYAPNNGKITITGLTAATAYNFTVTAIDVAQNESANSKTVAVTTEEHHIVPATAAPVPAWPAAQVKSLYSDAYEFAPASLNSYNEGWWENPTLTEETVGEDHFLHYNLYRNGMIGVQFAETSVATMEKIHIDVYASAAGTITFRPITAGDAEAINSTKQTLTLEADKWNSFDFDLADFGEHNWTKLFQYAIEGYQAGGLVGEHISVDNVYFYRTTAMVDNEKPTNVRANVAKASFGSITLNVSGEDNSGTVLYSIKIGDTEYANGAAATGVATTITVNNLTPGTNYNFNVVAYDEANNEANPVNVAAQTKFMPAAAPAPDFGNKKVVPVFTDAMACAVTGIHSGGWGEATQHEWLQIAPNDKVFYAQNFNYAGWHSWGGGNIDASEMDFMHVDIYSTGMTKVSITPISPGHEGSYTIELTPNAWTSADIPLSAYADNNIDWSNIFQFKFMNPVGGNELMIDNVYFWSYGAKASADNWATFAAPVAVKVPAGVTVYKAVYTKDGDDETLTLTNAGSVIPDNVGVLLSTEDASATYAFTLANSDEALDAESKFEGNSLVGCAVRTDISSVAASNDIFCLRRSDLFETSGFFLYTGQYIPAGKAYLPIPKEGAAPSPSRRVRFVFDSTTSVENTADAVRATKFIEDGQLFIRRGDVVYTIQGTPVK